MENRIAIGLITLSAVSMFGAPFPPAKELLESVRLQQPQQELNLDGQLREGPNVVPFRLIQSGPIIRYAFTKPDDALQLRLGGKDSRLEGGTREGVEKVAPAQYDHKVRGFFNDSEDPEMNFLSRPDALAT